MLSVVPDMTLSANVGSDRSWVWNAAADVSEGEPEAQTLAIRFANSESKLEMFTYEFFQDKLTHHPQTPTCSRMPSRRPRRRTRSSSALRSRTALRFSLPLRSLQWIATSRPSNVLIVDDFSPVKQNLALKTP
jgi:hypothetical protein